VRRAVLARALVHQPKALVLDEPTNSLDIAAFRELHRTMRQLAGRGVTIVLVTHHLPDIIPEINRVICLKAGRVAQDGTKAEILQSAVLSQLFDADIQIQFAGGHFQMW
jgi:iron complex transport system ATP-binding protein